MPGRPSREHELEQCPGQLNLVGKKRERKKPAKKWWDLGDHHSRLAQDFLETPQSQESETVGHPKEEGCSRPRKQQVQNYGGKFASQKCIESTHSPHTAHPHPTGPGAKCKGGPNSRIKIKPSMQH